ncbi:hypothetical protein ABZ348_32495 [Streptomyces sp. NPDC005963]|uniref:hypothetical protein n=1 Tax=Streptomyces sp. NPDC005963 TaxID=3156721 RepID=UPI0033F8C10B
MALEPQHLVARLFEEVAAEHFDFTVTASDSEDESRWLQLRGNSINLPYPHTDPPDEVLPAFEVFGNMSWSVESWAAEKYVTIDWGPSESGPDAVDDGSLLTGVVTRLAERYLGLPVASERWTVTEE